VQTGLRKPFEQVESGQHLKLYRGEAALDIPVSLGHRKSLIQWVSMVSLIVFCAVFASQGIAAAAGPFSDVEKSHWSYETLAEFADAGLIDGYSKEAFSGDRLITRYEMAWAISRVIPVSLSLRQLELRVRLQEEFQVELSLLQGASRDVSPTGQDEKQLATGSLGLGNLSTVSPMSTGPSPEAITGGKRLSEILGTEHPASKGISAGNPLKTISIPLDEGARAELSLGGTGPGLGQVTGDGDDVIARLDLKYALSQLAIFRASCELAKEDEASEDGEASAARATALLGIDYNFIVSDSAFVKAGYSYSRTADVPVPKGVKLGASGSLEQIGDGATKSASFFGDYSVPGLSLDARKHTASLGVGYTFGGTASVILGYKLIDFHELDPESQVPEVHRTNIATAELTIRF
jgi:hypothetical protein